jgi:hypothetical protein
MIETIKAYWAAHGQKTVATILGALAVVDLTPYEQDFKDLLPWPHWHAVLRLVGAAAIFWRATQK